MLRLTLSEEDIKELDYQRYHHQIASCVRVGTIKTGKTRKSQRT